MPPALLPNREAPETVWPLSVDRYHAMITAGILTADSPNYRSVQRYGPGISVPVGRENGRFAVNELLPPTEPAS